MITRGAPCPRGAGPRLGNVNLAGGEAVPCLIGFRWGNDVRGLINGCSSSDFPEVVARAPAGARMALMRCEATTTPLRGLCKGYSLLLLINLSGEYLQYPSVGCGEPDYMKQLVSGGTMRPEFGYQEGFYATIAAGEVFGTVIPSETRHFRFGYRRSSDWQWGTRSVEELAADRPVYLLAHTAAGADWAVYE